MVGAKRDYVCTHTYSHSWIDLVNWDAFHRMNIQTRNGNRNWRRLICKGVGRKREKKPKKWNKNGDCDEIVFNVNPSLALSLSIPFSPARAWENCIRGIETQQVSQYENMPASSSRWEIFFSIWYRCAHRFPLVLEKSNVKECTRTQILLCARKLTCCLKLVKNCEKTFPYPISANKKHCERFVWIWEARNNLYYVSSTLHTRTLETSHYTFHLSIYLIEVMFSTLVLYKQRNKENPYTTWMFIWKADFWFFEIKRKCFIGLSRQRNELSKVISSLCFVS